MQIDFHHTATYAIARMAGFQHADAAVVAHAAQYVDDATKSGVIRFDDGRLFSRSATAHKALDLGNFKNPENVATWMPFHFVPGNCGLPAGAPATADPVERLVCSPGSPLALDMALAALGDSGEAFALHRLGIAAHALADTWAHQGFVGMVDPLNEASGPRSNGKRLLGPVERAWRTVQVLTGMLPPSGHLRAFVYPDLPYLDWEYEDRNGRRVRRENPTAFVEASDALARLFRLYLQRPAATAPVAGLSQDQQGLLHRLFLELRHPDGHVRRELWLDELEKGQLGFAPVRRADLAYVATGLGSWKEDALGEGACAQDPNVPFHEKVSFTTSHWRLFHLAAKKHRTFVMETLLPKYGIAV